MADPHAPPPTIPPTRLLVIVEGASWRSVHDTIREIGPERFAVGADPATSPESATIMLTIDGRVIFHGRLVQATGSFPDGSIPGAGAIKLTAIDQPRRPEQGAALAGGAPGQRVGGGEPPTGGGGACANTCSSRRR